MAPVVRVRTAIRHPRPNRTAAPVWHDPERSTLFCFNHRGGRRLPTDEDTELDRSSRHSARFISGTSTFLDSDENIDASSGILRYLPDENLFYGRALTVLDRFG